MSKKGHLALVLHAHLPFVRHPEHESFLEEEWLFEAITECYLPLLEVFERLVNDGIEYRISMVLTPSLVSMLSDDLLRERYIDYLDSLTELAAREVRRTRRDAELQPLARMYESRFKHARARFVDSHEKDLAAAFGDLQRTGSLELLTSAATHAYLPLFEPFPLAVSAQIRTALVCHRGFFGKQPEGIWLPECGYFHGLDEILQENGLRYFFTDTHGVLHADPRPLYGVYEPIMVREGLAVFGRDRYTSHQVWSAREGFPADPEYRDFFRDIGFDLDRRYLENHIQPTGERKTTGIKYHRITGSDEKKLYRPLEAEKKAIRHAERFVEDRARHISALAETMAGRCPVVSSLYDAELFGHWWFEGPAFIEALLRYAARQNTFSCILPSGYLKANPVHQLCSPASSSWGNGGYSEMWLDESNDWIYRHLHRACVSMISLAGEFSDAAGLLRRYLDQAARELMLAQASDWAFIMKTKTSVGYAVKRTIEHLKNFRELEKRISAKALDEKFVTQLENLDNLFSDMDYRCFRSDYVAPW